MIKNRRHAESRNRENESRPEQHEQDGHRYLGEFVTSDTAVIVKRIGEAHPAARVVVMAAEAQEREVGDGTNFVVSFAGELLSLAEELIRRVAPEIRGEYQSVGEVFGVVGRGVSY